jgi:hypothetical protein
MFTIDGLPLKKGYSNIANYY